MKLREEFLDIDMNKATTDKAHEKTMALAEVWEDGVI